VLLGNTASEAVRVRVYVDAGKLPETLAPVRRAEIVFSGRAEALPPAALAAEGAYVTVPAEDLALIRLTGEVAQTSAGASGRKDRN
jgi:hypothetical protein